ncbi:uncharacterized protein DEA37_0009757, partial [Paragonimus westermani]
TVENDIDYGHYTLGFPANPNLCWFVGSLTPNAMQCLNILVVGMLFTCTPLVLIARNLNCDSVFRHGDRDTIVRMFGALMLMIGTACFLIVLLIRAIPVYCVKNETLQRGTDIASSVLLFFGIVCFMNGVLLYPYELYQKWSYVMAIGGVMIVIQFVLCRIGSIVLLYYRSLVTESVEE